MNTCNDNDWDMYTANMITLSEHEMRRQNVCFQQHIRTRLKCCQSVGTVTVKKSL